MGALCEGKVRTPGVDRYNDGPVTLGMGINCELIVQRVGIGRGSGGDPVWRESQTLPEDLHFNNRANTDIHCGTPDGILYDRLAGTFSPDAQEGYAILPDTEANQHKLRQLLSSFDVLSKHISLLLQQDRIDYTLQHMKTLALPSPNAAPGIYKEPGDA